MPRSHGNLSDFVCQQQESEDELCLRVLGIDFDSEDMRRARDIRKALGKGSKKKFQKKLTNVSFVCVCVAGNGQMLVFFWNFFLPTIV